MVTADIVKGNQFPPITREFVRNQIHDDSVSDELIDHTIDVLLAVDASTDIEHSSMGNLHYNEITGEFEEI